MLVPEMHFQHKDAANINQEVFRSARHDPAIFRRIYNSADVIRQKLEAFIEEYQIEVLVPQNASCIPMNIPLGIAIADTIKRTQIWTLAHHHDFYWERERFINNNIQDILDEAFPPNLKTMGHMCISTVMQRRLKAWRGIDSFYLPNVFDFENPPPAPDEYANSFRAEMGLSEDDLIVLQPTRIIRRKAIEKAIELVRKLDDKRLVLVITGYEGDEPTEYGPWLREEADRAGIRYMFIGKRVNAERGTGPDGEKIFSLWDIYPHAHFITYPSIYEGFGNALIETLYFRKPLVVHQYPAYLADIKPAGVRAVEFYHDLSEEVLAQTREIIDHAALREEMAEQNYAAGLHHFSYKTLRLTLFKAWYDLMH
jgi:glycosyltransferase involved in cell wall biosynthesis